MVFDSYTFFVFFAVILLLYFKLPHKAQNGILLVGSYFFYGCWDWRFLSLIVISTIVDYLAGQRISDSKEAFHRKLWLTTSCVVNLGLLGFFKYYGFFASELNEFIRVLGMNGHLQTLNVILPVGISFYTFQTMSYTIDVYRRKTEPMTCFSDFALYVSFFPQLVAGPIERSVHLIPQITAPRKVDGNCWAEGSYMILLGLVQKVVIADNAAIVADMVFNGNLEELSAFECVIGVYAFAFQIYGDFSGYSLIARGTARLLGFDLMMNFNFPYFSTAPRFLWRRWHISLSSWLRDYLYIPLGGSRNGRLRNYGNLMLTMLLGGLWHGAAWRFVAWGALHGGLLAVDRKLLGKRERDQLFSSSGLLGAIITFHCVCVSWVFFRAADLSGACSMLWNIASAWGTTGELGIPMAVYLALFCLPLLLFELWLYRKGNPFAILTKSWIVQAFFFFVLCCMLVFLGAPSRHEFIYFQF